MKKVSTLLLSLLVMSGHAFAQVESQTIDGDIDTEIDQMYQSSQPQQRAVTKSQGSVVNQTVVVPAQSQMVSQARPAIQAQPTTLIEASPLSDSRADMIRKNRQEEEMKTESKIVEKLEQSRMEDEKRRAQALFGDKFDNMQNRQVETAAAQMAPAPQPVQPVYVEPKETVTRDAIREEVRAALDDDKTAVTAPIVTRYFSATAGISEYPDVANVRGNYSLGAAFGTRYDYFLVEGGFMMSNFEVGVINYARGGVLENYDVNQYTGTLAAKYQMMSGFVRPILGGIVAYSYRKYAVTNGLASANQDTGNSHAIDLGVNVGVDLEFNQNFTLGVDYRYMFNMSSRITSAYPNSSYGQVGTPLEKLQYYVAGLVARVNF